MGMIDEQPRSACVETLEPCEMLRISRSAFENVPEGHFDAGDA